LCVDNNDVDDYSYTEEDVNNYLMAMQQKKKTTRSAKLSAGSKSASWKQHTESDDDANYNSANKSYDSNASYDDDNVSLLVLQQDKEKKKQSVAPRKNKAANLPAASRAVAVSKPNVVSINEYL
jgi:hypothetical protein